jgi:pimeloyl-ACP methyl ester carboxylesterase
VCRPEANGTLPLNERRLNIICISNHGDCIHMSIIILTNDLLLKQDLNTKDLETNVIVLVHGGGFGAWCWYKTMSLLEDSGFKVNAIDLTGSGIHCSDTNKISSLSEYAEPLTSYLKGLGDAEKVWSLFKY